MKKTCLLLLMMVLILWGFGHAVQAAPVAAPISGGIGRITINDPADHWSGGTIEVGGSVVILPRNLLIDLPANRLTLKQIFDQAPAACQTSGPGGTKESGLAEADICNTSGGGGFVTLSANITNGGNAIAGDVFIQKGIEAVTGPVTYINYTDGYFRINGATLNATQVDDNTGTMVRLNDPTSRHSIQQGLGCGAVDPGTGRVPDNCSADPRFTLDPDNYVIVFTTGYPVCIPSTVSRQFADALDLNVNGNTTELLTAQSGATGTGDLLCPTTNRTISGGQPVDDSRLFAPIMLGDMITAEGNYETINCARFLSAHTMTVRTALTTKNLPTQPDYMFLDEVGIDAPGFQNERARTLFIGFATLNTDVLIWSLHRDPATNAAHEFPLATVQGCDVAGGIGTCSAQGLVGVNNIFKIRHDVDFLVGADPKLDPCAHIIADARFGSGFCPGGSTIANMLSILSPIPHEIQARTGHSLQNPGLITLDINGLQATNGQYLFPLGVNLGGVGFPEFVEINLNALNTAYSFTGIPWNLDRRLSPGGCNGACEGTPQPLDPFPFEGSAMDPRFLAATPQGNYNDPHFTNSLLTRASDRIFSYVSGTPFAGGVFNFDGDNTRLITTWPPALDPAPIVIPPVPPLPIRTAVVAITSTPVFTASQNQLYSYQVTATNASACGGLTYSLDLIPAPPAGITIDPATGLIQWTPTAAQVGFHPVTVRATEPGGAFDTQPFGVDVAGTGPVVLKPAKNDFDKDGKTDITIWRTADGTWYTLRSGDRLAQQASWGTGTLFPNPDVPVAGDYDGDGITDLAVWRPGDGNWYIQRSSDGAVAIQPWGTLNDIPVPGDYDGDGKTDYGVFRPSDGNWYLINSLTGTVTNRPWGATGDKPVPGDYDGDGKEDIGVWRPADGTWHIVNSLALTVTDRQFGTLNDIPVPADYDGDGKADLAVYRPSEGNWYIIHSSTGALTTTLFGGLPGDLPVPGDYDGDGKTDIGIYRPATGEWFLIPTGIGVPVTILWGGLPLDVPIASIIR